MGFRECSATAPANFKLIKLDTERHNISMHFRRIQHSVSGWKFRDLEWLISERNGDDPSCWPKTIIYCEAIDLGHRMVTALRKLLPPALSLRAREIIRHIHSLRCPLCKAEAMTEFGAPGIAASCRIVVATDAFGMGIDIPDIIRVILFPSPRTLSSAIQCIGRAACDPAVSGKAIVHVDKSYKVGSWCLVLSGVDIRCSW
jgi:superfamily II DNA/RNA helicase